jgi:outer membrane protein OmpA-like peptidoglycan-associated protein
MIPPPLRSDLPATGGQASQGTVVHPDLGPSALASPVGVEGVMHAEPPAPTHKSTAAETPKPPAKTVMPEAIAAKAPATERPTASPAPVARAEAPTGTKAASAPGEPAVSMTPPELTGSTWGAVDAADLPPPPPDLPLPSATGPGTAPAAPSPTAKAAAAPAAGPSASSAETGPERLAAVAPPKRTRMPAIGAPGTGGKRLEVEFASGSATLDDAARGMIREAAEAYRNNGRRIRIVGHAASGIADRTADDHMLANFEMSLKRATAVSDELMRLGVDPSVIVVEAVGDRSSDGTPGAVSEARSHSADIYLE